MMGSASDALAEQITALQELAKLVDPNSPEGQAIAEFLEALT